MKLLLDMNLAPRWVGMLQAAGFDAVHWSAVGAATAGDAEIMAFAAVRGLIVITHDMDFGAMLAASGGNGPSVVQIRSGNLTPEAIGNAVAAALRQASAELAAGALLTIDPGRQRLRLLPLRPRS